MSVVGDLLSALSCAPNLPDAGCKGMAPTFDEPAQYEAAAAVEDRHRTSLAICSTCPELDRCRQYVMSLPKHRRPTGVVGGLVIKPTKKRKEVA